MTPEGEVIGRGKSTHEVKGMCVNGSQHLSEGAKRGRYNAMMKVTNAVSTVSLVKFCLSKSHID